MSSRTIKVIIDPSLRSPATPDVVAETIDAALADIAPRPAPSCVELWVMGATVADAARIGEACVSKRETNTRVQAAAERQFISNARTLLVGRAKGAFDDPPRRSPIAETIQRVVMWPTRSASQAIAIITDGREESDLASMECGTLPTPEAFKAAILRERVFERGSLRGIDFYFVRMGFTASARKGCLPSVKRERDIQDLWAAALTAGSAGRPVFTAGVPDFAPPFEVES